MFRLALILTFAASLANASPEFWRHEWPNTDFDTTSVENWVEIMSGGPPKDGIPAINDPSFIDVADEARQFDSHWPCVVAMRGNFSTSAINRKTLRLGAAAAAGGLTYSPQYRRIRARAGAWSDHRTVPFAMLRQWR